MMLLQSFMVELLKGQIRFERCQWVSSSQSWVEYDHSTAKFAIGWNAQTRAFGGANNEFGLYYNTPSNLDSNAHELVIGGGTGSGGMTLFNSTSGQGNIFFADGIGSAAAKKMGRMFMTILMTQCSLRLIVVKDLHRINWSSWNRN